MSKNNNKVATIHWQKAADDAAKQALRSTTSNVFSIQARGTVGDTTETLFAIFDRSKRKRLLWRERPVFAVAPIGVP